MLVNLVAEGAESHGVYLLRHTIPDSLVVLQVDKKESEGLDDIVLGELLMLNACVTHLCHEDIP